MDKGIVRGYKDPLEIYIKNNLEKSISIFSETLDPYFIINMSGQIVFVNQACQSFLGFEEEELLKMSLIDICGDTELNRTQTYFLKDDREKLTSFYMQIMNKEKKFFDIDVTCFPIFSNNDVIGTYIVFRDAQGMIVQQKKHLSTLIEHSPDAIFILKGRTIVEISQVALSMIGVERKEELIGESIYMLMDAESIDLFNRKLQLVHDGQITDLFEQKMLTVDGVILDVEVKALPTVFNGEPASHVIVRDTGERKKLSLISEKQAVAGQLAAGIAHEIRNPITAIKGFLKLIMAETKKQISYFKIIDTEIERIELILKELMILAKPNEIKYERVYIGSLIENVMTLMESQALLNDIEVLKDIHLHNINIIGDENQLKQVFINYIKNAIEAMPSGGKLHIHGEQNHGKIRIQIIDEGEGIPPEIQARLGEPFFTTKENGTGLGLLVSSQIVKEHKGLVNIISDENGTCIEVELPSIE